MTERGVNTLCVCVRMYLAVFSSGCLVPTSFLTCMATLLNSSLSRQRRLMKEVGYPTIFSASDTTLLQLDGDGPENRLKLLHPRLGEPREPREPRRVRQERAAILEKNSNNQNHRFSAQFKHETSFLSHFLSLISFSSFQSSSFSLSRLFALAVILFLSFFSSISFFYTSFPLFLVLCRLSSVGICS